jgi:hypothetical protein
VLTAELGLTRGQVDELAKKAVVGVLAPAVTV